MVKYDKSTIYKICCKDPEITDIYVGSTTNFSRRKACHKSNCNNENDKSHNLKVYKTIRDFGGWDNWDMVEVERYCATDKKDLHARERFWLEELGATLNKNIPTQSQVEYYAKNKEKYAEYQVEYYVKNKEKYAEYQSEYYAKNKEKRVEYQTEYHAKNKEKYTEYQTEYRAKNKEKYVEYYAKNKEKYVEYYAKNKEKRVEYQTEYYAKNKEKYAEYHAKNKEKYAEYQAEYRAKNKEKMVEYQAEYRAKNKEKVHCECGSKVNRTSLSIHLKSKKHQNKMVEKHSES
jgi:hypothetical protein